MNPDGLPHCTGEDITTERAAGKSGGRPQERRRKRCTPQARGRTSGPLHSRALLPSELSSVSSAASVSRTESKWGASPKIITRISR